MARKRPWTAGEREALRLACIHAALRAQPRKAVVDRLAGVLGRTPAAVGDQITMRGYFARGAWRLLRMNA